MTYLIKFQSHYPAHSNTQCTNIVAVTATPASYNHTVIESRMLSNASIPLLFFYITLQHLSTTHVP